jgi:hypothetical protein
VVRIKPLGELLTDGRYLETLIWGKGQAGKLDAWIKKTTGGKGLIGVDLERPLGMYMFWSALWKEEGPDYPGVVLVPVSDEKKFLDLLRQLEAPVKKRKDGSYEFTIFDEEFILRFAHRYAFIAQQPTVLPARLPDPVTLWPRVRSTNLVTASLRVDRIAEKEKKKFIKNIIEEGLEEYLGDRNKQPTESEDQARERLAHV